MDEQAEPIELYRIPKMSRIYAECSDGSTYVTFHHIDGSYSYCETEKGGIGHLCAWTPLVPHLDGYRILEDKRTD